jgi:hypothetical protein
VEIAQGQRGLGLATRGLRRRRRLGSGAAAG